MAVVAVVGPAIGESQERAHRWSEQPLAWVRDSSPYEGLESGGHVTGALSALAGLVVAILLSIFSLIGGELKIAFASAAIAVVCILLAALNLGLGPKKR